MPTELKVTLSVSFDHFDRPRLRVWVMDANGNQAEDSILIRDLLDTLEAR